MAAILFWILTIFCILPACVVGKSILHLVQEPKPYVNTWGKKISAEEHKRQDKLNIAIYAPIALLLMALAIWTYFAML